MLIRHCYRLIGTFEQNNVGMKLLTPLAVSVQSLSTASDSAVIDKYLDAASCIIDNLPGKLRILHLIISNLIHILLLECESMNDDDDEEDEADIEAEEIQEEDDIASEDDDDEAEDTFPTSTGNPSLDELHTLLNEHGLDKVFPPLDGTAFYTNICKINHSCVPNVIVTYTTRSHLKSTPVLGLSIHELSGVDDEYRSDGLVALVKVLKPIQPGEELVPSYIDTSLGTILLHCIMLYSILSKTNAIVYTDYADRQAALQDYGFTCTCSKCIEEVAAMKE